MRGGWGTKLQIDGVIKFGRAETLWKIVKLKCGCDVLPAKREEGGVKKAIKIT